MNLIAADIGGTHSRFVWHTGSQSLQRGYENACFSDLNQVIDQFLRDLGDSDTQITHMVLGLPAPVDRPVIQLTNIDWQVDPEDLQRRFPVKALSLINDFQAAALGALHDKQAARLNPDAPVKRSGPAVVAGAGTGLGHAWFADISSDAMPWATEGGHADFAPQDRQQYELHAWLSERHKGHVSLERVLSGAGLAALYEFLGGTSASAAEVQELARKNDATAVEAIHCFVRIFGAHVGNVALQFNPVAGIHLCGGVVAHLADWFGQSFLSAVADKGRMRPHVESIPLFLHQRHDIGLQGALYIAKGKVELT